MKGFVLSLVMLTLMVGSLYAEKLPNRYENYADAHAAAVKQDKRMFVMFTASWCDPCTRFKRNVLYRKAIWESLEKWFVIHLVDTDVETETVTLFRKTGYPCNTVPTLFFLNQGATKVTGVNVGGLSATNFRRWYNIVHKIKE